MYFFLIEGDNYGYGYSPNYDERSIKLVRNQLVIRARYSCSDGDVLFDFNKTSSLYKLWKFNHKNTLKYLQDIIDSIGRHIRKIAGGLTDRYNVYFNWEKQLTVVDRKEYFKLKDNTRNIKSVKRTLQDENLSPQEKLEQIAFKLAGTDC